MGQALTKEEKRSVIDGAWKAYRAGIAIINRNEPEIPFDQYLAADDRLWRVYLAIEKEMTR